MYRVVFKWRSGNMVSRLCTLLYSVPKFTGSIQNYSLYYSYAWKTFCYGRFWTDRDLCSFWNEAIETLPHILIECALVRIFWKELKYWQLLKSGIFLQPSLRDYNRLPKSWLMIDENEVGLKETKIPRKIYNRPRSRPHQVTFYDM